MVLFSPAPEKPAPSEGSQIRNHRGTMLPGSGSRPCLLQKRPDSAAAKKFPFPALQGATRGEGAVGDHGSPAAPGSDFIPKADRTLYGVRSAPPLRRCPPAPPLPLPPGAPL